jgi:hypothetical protein
MRELHGPRWRVQRALMLATSRLRAEPSFLVIGASQSGTTSFFSYLTAGPQVLPALAKEVRYFDRYYAKGRDWYRSFFPLRAAAAGAAVGEATPAYMWHPHVPARVREFDPGMRLIALLRDPVDRAYSDFHKRREKHSAGLTFEQGLEREAERTKGELERMRRDPGYVSAAYRRFAYVDKGRYADQLERWLEHFPREQLLVLTSEELQHDPAAAVAGAARFLGVPEPPPQPDYRRSNTGSYEPMRAETRRRLAALFAEPNRRLYELVGRDLGWTRP